MKTVSPYISKNIHCQATAAHKKSSNQFTFFVRSCALIEQVCLLVYINQSQLLPFVIFCFL